MAGRPAIVGPEAPEKPFPVVVQTEITGGFGRGSSELGIPTANIPPGKLTSLDAGVYFGWARVAPYTGDGARPAEVVNGERRIAFNYGAQLDPSEQAVFPMVMSIGWNPYFKNKEKSAEVHIMHNFSHAFYGASIGVVVAGFIRPEQSYDSLDALVEDINTDIAVAKRSLSRPAYESLRAAL